MGPQLEEDHPDVQIFIFDHNKDHMVTWAKALLNSSHPAAKYVDGTAYHWYVGGMVRTLVLADGFTMDLDGFALARSSPANRLLRKSDSFFFFIFGVVSLLRLI